MPALLVMLSLLAAPARADEERTVVVADDAALSERMLPPGGRVALCEGGACPTGIERIDAEDLALSVARDRGTVTARVIVVARLPLLGRQRLVAPTSCSARPEIDAAGVLHLREPQCRVGELPGLADSVGSVVAERVGAYELDALESVRAGALAAHDRDPRLAGPCARRCVTGVALASPLAHGGRTRVALRVRLRDASCCPR